MAAWASQIEEIESKFESDLRAKFKDLKELDPIKQIKADIQDKIQKTEVRQTLSGGSGLPHQG